jgi:hypothetical protein
MDGLVVSLSRGVGWGREALACLRPVRCSCYFVPVPKSTKSCSERRVNDEKTASEERRGKE